MVGGWVGVGRVRIGGLALRGLWLGDWSQGS